MTTQRLDLSQPLSVPQPDTLEPPSGIIIERVQPEIDGGRYPAKRVAGDILEVSADIFKDGHDTIAAVVKYRRKDADDWQEAEMRHVDNDRWVGHFLLTDNTRCVYTIEAFPDRWATWQDEVEKKFDAGQDVALELREGRLILQDALSRAVGDDRETLAAAIAVVDNDGNQATTVRILLAPEVEAAMRRARSRRGGKVYDRELEVVVDRLAARYAAWYEMFPRSAGTDPTRGATFAEAAQRLPVIAAMGFDVVYLTPIHPIGRAFRKGKNNTIGAGPDDPGVPYGIGSEEGGHDAIEPGLGTLEDFRAFVAAAAALGMEVALDVAFQASPDHLWAKEHPEWFTIRPDGTIHYAENPPKKYQDIYPLNFDTLAWRELWLELRRVILFWVAQGVKTFRVDNPHTKSIVFWEWLIADVQHDHPEVIFLSEAFTRPKVMKVLAKAGFTQSYTYFTWRNFKSELEAYFTELTQSEMTEYYRGNLFPNTHDILPYILQEGGRPAFKMRFALAATLSSVYGIYSSYELGENTPVPGREEYLNSEKYEHKVWDWDRPGNIIPYITRINAIRRAHPALHRYDNLRFYPSDDENITAYGKATADGEDRVLIVVNLDPFDAHETWLHLPLAEWGLEPDEPFQVEDLLSGETHLWHAHQHIRLDPHDEPARLYAVRPIRRVSYVEGCG
ncbi:MAG: alpha-1,4-glucan--maltose-1-phosphate maltosyltransferase [Chloroflexota bacterium]|nr:alpha-1,4-glucan--maltose-1-phosphate maltosyltransferase [Chloroflexota bacterium]